MNPETRSVRRVSEAQLKEIVNRLLQQVSPRRIILFGSQARGEPTRDSDVDLMIIIDDDDVDRFELSRRGYASLRGLGLPVELHFCRANTFERFSTVIGSIQREVKQHGRIIYAA